MKLSLFKKTPPPMSAKHEVWLRQILWRDHSTCGFLQLRGNRFGELKCDGCNIDFRRDDLSHIIETLYTLGAK